MEQVLFLKPKEEIIIQDRAIYILEKKAINGNLYLTTTKFLFINVTGNIEFYIPINNIMGVCSHGFMSKFLVIQYLSEKERPLQTTFKVKKANQWVKAIHNVITIKK